MGRGRRFSGSRRWLAPLALVVSALVMLFQGVKLVFVNWRLTTVEILPAMWIWLATLNLDLMSAVRTTRAALPSLLARAGAIVTVCSVNATLPDPLVIDYSAAKAACLSFFKSLSKEVGGLGVRVNTVSPGPVATDLWLGKGGVAETVAGAVGAEPGNVAAQAAAGSVTGRFTRPEEVADLVVFLASERVGNLTGADIVIDGGLTQTM